MNLTETQKTELAIYKENYKHLYRRWKDVVNYIYKIRKSNPRYRKFNIASVHGVSLFYKKIQGLIPTLKENKPTTRE